MEKLLLSFVVGVSPAFSLILGIQNSVADTATWKANPRSDNWNRAENWNPETIPNGPSDIATFAASSRIAVSLSANTEVNGIVFNAGASAFTITASRDVTLNIGGVGITNNSGIPQNFVASRSHRNTTPGEVEFTDSATAGSLTFFTNEGSALNQASGGITRGGITHFGDNSSASDGTFINR